MNNTVRCFSLLFEPKDLLEIESVSTLFLNKHISSEKLNVSIRFVKTLKIDSVSSNKISQILAKIRRIDVLQIENCKLQDLDLKSTKINSFIFLKTTFLEPLELNSNISSLELFNCEGLNKLSCYRVIRLKLYDFSSKDDIWDLLRKIKGIKSCSINRPISEIFNNLCSTVREINFCSKKDFNSVNLAAVKQAFPYLFSINVKTPLAVCMQLDLRVINPIISNSHMKLNIRPRAIKLSEKSSRQISKFPELFEKLEHIHIMGRKFNFDCLPKNIKKVWLYEDIDLESRVLTRFESKWLKV